MRIALSLLAASLAAGCAADKAPPDDLDLGAELTSKADSATQPSSIVTITPGTVVATTFTRRAQHRAFVFDGVAGQRVQLWVDGLDGLDTVARLYKVSASTGRPYARALATNDDTEIAGWVLATNVEHNEYSSSIDGHVLPATGRYALVASLYFAGDTGVAEVKVGAAALTEAALIATAKAYAWPGPTEEPQLYFADAAAYQAYLATGPTESFRWLHRDGDTATAAKFVAGSNDLWAIQFEVDRVSGDVTLTGEH